MCSDGLALVRLAGRRCDVLGHIWVLTPTPTLGTHGAYAAHAHRLSWEM